MKKTDAGVGINAYALHRAELGLPGKTRAAVQKAIASGRLAASLVYVGGHARIRDVDAADREWAASTKSDRVPLTNGAADGSSSARSRGELALAQIAEMEAGKMRGELIGLNQVVLEVSTILTLARNSLLGVPHKVKALRPDLTREDVLVVDELIREVLTELADACERSDVLPKGATNDE